MSTHPLSDAISERSDADMVLHAAIAADDRRDGARMILNSWFDGARDRNHCYDMGKLFVSAVRRWSNAVEHDRVDLRYAAANAHTVITIDGVDYPPAPIDYSSVRYRVSMALAEWRDMENRNHAGVAYPWPALATAIKVSRLQG